MEGNAKSKRRFQFSLRTLMLAVLVYGVLWVITIKWGANQIACDLKIVINDPEIHWVSKADGSFSYDIPIQEFNAECVSHAPIPFVVIWTVDTAYSRGSDIKRARHQLVYLWFLGAYKKLSNDTNWVGWPTGGAPNREDSTSLR